MSWLVVKKVRELLAQYPNLTSPIDIELLAKVNGCEIIEWPFLRPVKEVKQGRWIGLAKDLDTSEQRYLVAHAIGHHLLHCGNQLSFQKWQGLTQHRQEREADEFAARVLMPDDDLSSMIGTPIWEMAEHFGVPEELVIRRINEYATPEEVDRWEQKHEDLSVD
jgi:hypothetical protein